MCKETSLRSLCMCEREGGGGSTVMCRDHDNVQRPLVVSGLTMNPRVAILCLTFPPNLMIKVKPVTSFRSSMTSPQVIQGLLSS